jgi:hypothetical protein
MVDEKADPPSGMTAARKGRATTTATATAMAMAKATAKTKANAGVLRCAQNDRIKKLGP